MFNIYIPINAKFKSKQIRLLDVDTGLEFVAIDIFKLVSTLPLEVLEPLIKKLPDKFKRSRFIQLVEVVEVDTLCWLGLKYVFSQYNYQQQTSFIRWLRKDVKVFADSGQNIAALLESSQSQLAAPKRSSISRTNKSNLIVPHFDKLNWFNKVTIPQLDTLALMHQNDCFRLSGIPPSLVPTIDANRISSDSELNSVYLSLLYKKVDIPILEETSLNLSQQLLSTLYLNCAQAVLNNQDISYVNLYSTFVSNSHNLLLAQELDLAIIFHYTRNFFPFPLIRVLEGSIFLQALYGCNSCQIITSRLALALKFAYLNWLSTLIDNFSFKVS